jgi:hypothetical protein
VVAELDGGSRTHEAKLGPFARLFVERVDGSGRVAEATFAQGVREGAARRRRRGSGDCGNRLGSRRHRQAARQRRCATVERWLAAGRRVRAGERSEQSDERAAPHRRSSRRCRPHAPFT